MLTNYKLTRSTYIHIYIYNARNSMENYYIVAYQHEINECWCNFIIFNSAISEIEICHFLIEQSYFMFEYCSLMFEYRSCDPCCHETTPRVNIINLCYTVYRICFIFNRYLQRLPLTPYLNRLKIARDPYKQNHRLECYLLYCFTDWLVICYYIQNRAVDTRAARNCCCLYSFQYRMTLHVCLLVILILFFNNQLLIQLQQLVLFCA